MARVAFAFLCFSLFCLLVSVQCFKPMSEYIREQLSIKKRYASSRSANTFAASSFPVYMGPQDGLKDADAIQSLPGQPQGIDFAQYSGYVTVDPSAGRALFYYFTESPHNSSTKPLVLWLNGGPGCSSFGAGAMMELGPLRVNKDGLTLSRNKYSWNNDANILFLESPAGVGFSYSNRTSDYNSSGDSRTAQDSYTFLVNWLERFPEYKTRDFYITGESYAGHYVPQLAQTIVHNNKNTNQTVINLKGIAIGNAVIDDETISTGWIDFKWSHAFMSDEAYKGVEINCNFSTPSLSDPCLEYLDKIDTGNIYGYDVYAPLCGSSSPSIPLSAFDPCTEDYINTYLNIPQVQAALHANVTSLPYPWENCSPFHEWLDSPSTILPVIEELMESGIRLWIYSGDVDGVLPVTTSRYAINKIGPPVKTAWYPWYSQGEVGGFAVGYQNLTFVTIRGAGHFVPSYQPDRALVFFSSFINGVLPPSS